MATPQSDAGVVAALNSAGNSGIPDPAKIAADKAIADAKAADAALAAVAGQQEASPEAVAAVKAWQASPTPELKAAAQAAVAADRAAATAKAAADPAAKAAQLETLQAASTAAMKASVAAPNDSALKAAYDSAVKAVNDFVAQKPPVPTQGSEPAKKDDVKLTAPTDKTVSEADVQRLELFAKKHSFSQAQADALLADAREVELGRRAQYTALQQQHLQTIQGDIELGGTAERVNLTLERARIGAKHLFTADELLEMEKSGDANKPALVRACLRHYNMALASPSLVNGDPIKTAEKKLDPRNPDDLAAAFKADAAKKKE